MSSTRAHRTCLLLAAALVPLAQAQAASCNASGATAVTVGSVAEVAPGAARSFSVALDAGQGIIVDLSSIAPDAGQASGDADDEQEADHSASPARSLALCDSRGLLLAPLPGEVFEKGGSIVSTEDGERLRFVAATGGQYVISIAADDAPRELLVRRRKIRSSQTPVVSAALGAERTGIVSSEAPMVFSFTGVAGQWVELKSVSEKDTVLRLAGPDRDGAYSVIAENDDSEGLNPVIRRKLPVAGTYYLQVDSLAEEPGEFTLALKGVEAPRPAPPPASLRLNTRVTGRLADEDAVNLYALQVVAGHSYRLELTAPYDGVVAIGLANPIEPEDGGSGADAGFAEVKSQDANTSGTERLDFTARSSGQLQVRVKSFGIGDSNGDYTLKATDLGS